MEGLQGVGVEGTRLGVEGTRVGVEGTRGGLEGTRVRITSVASSTSSNQVCSQITQFLILECSLECRG